MIYRIDPELAFRQGLWVVVGVGVFAALVALPARTTASWTASSTSSASRRSCSSSCPRSRTSGGRSTARRSGSTSAAESCSSPASSPRCCSSIFLAGYLRDNREMLSYGRGRPGAPAVAEAPRPAPAHLGRRDARALPDERPRRRAALLRHLPRDALHGDGALVVRRRRARALRWRAPTASTRSIPHVQTRVGIWLDPWADPADTSYQLVQSLYAISSGGVFGSGLGNGVLLSPEGNPYIPFLETDFIFSAIAQELGLAGAAGVILLYLIFAYRGLRISMLAVGRLLQAAGRRPHRRRLHPGVHHHRRRHRADPADGDHAPVHLLRRLEHRRELHRPRPSCSWSRPREPG